MKLLLDTQVLLWWLHAPEKISGNALDAIQDGRNVVFVSAASAWEIEIKRSLGKLDAPGDLAEQLRRHRFEELPVHIRHAAVLRSLPVIHRDPFDRILVAQGIAEKLVLVTSDRTLPRYPIRCLA